MKGSPDVKRHTLTLIALALAVAAAGVTAGSVGARQKASPIQVVIWHGYTAYEGKAIDKAVATYNKTHPTVHVTAQFAAANGTVFRLVPFARSSTKK